MERFLGQRILIFLVYNVALWFSVVYLSQHWVIDIFAGMAWATLWFAIILLAWPWIGRAAMLPVWLRERLPVERLSSARVVARVRRS